MKSREKVSWEVNNDGHYAIFLPVLRNMATALETVPGTLRERERATTYKYSGILCTLPRPLTLYVTWHGSQG